MNGNAQPASEGRIGTTVAESEPHWPNTPAASTPNVLLVIIDDCGWSDFGCYGSEIATPAIDALATDGLRYVNFHVTPLCSPSRACLLTGRNHHAVGMRFLADADTGFPNSRGRVDSQVPNVWRLYDTRSDFSEVNDLAVERPEALAELVELVELWWRETRANGVLPIDERSLVELIRLRTPLGMHNRREVVLRPGQSVVPFATRVTGSDRSMRAQVELRGRRGGDNGVLIASGSSIGGYVLYVHDDLLHFEHLCLRQRVLCVASGAMPEGDGVVGFRLTRGEQRTAVVELLHGEEVVGRAQIGHTSGHLSFFGLTVCCDPILQVGLLYQGGNDYPKDGVKQVRLGFFEPTSPALSATLLRATE